MVREASAARSGPLAACRSTIRSRRAAAWTAILMRFYPASSFSCPGGATTTNCTSAAVGAAGTYATAHAAVSDTANAATPGNTVASGNGSLTVDSELIAYAARRTPTGGGHRAHLRPGEYVWIGWGHGLHNRQLHDFQRAGKYVSPATMTTTAGTFALPAFQHHVPVLERQYYRCKLHRFELERIGDRQRLYSWK